ncbi:hypothetical protein B0H11DRAFT_2195438 [Mycena galericulata]|nr:hypothetical protein B0H11DRAFT_2195438 [Mycena galericulata]
MYTSVRSSTRVPPTAPPTYPVRFGSAPGARDPQVSANAPQSDTTPLLPQKGPASSSKQRNGGLICFALIALLIIVHWSPVEDALNRNRIRREWSKELDAHERVRRAWGAEVAGHEAVRAGWEVERQEIVVKREQLTRDRETWVQERETGRREEERRLKEAENKLIAMREQLMRDRETWVQERETGRREEERRLKEAENKLIAMREQLMRDRETWAQECEAGKREEESRRKEAADRVRAGFAWDGLQAQQRCQRHGAREYTARIVNVPRGYDPIQACTETAVEIHGMKIPRPLQCEDRAWDRGCGGVIGHWTVDYGEPTCITHFDNFKDKGCTFPGSGLKRIESHLENLQGGDDWRDMCSTTPADFLHLHFDSPHMCENWGKYGVWGMWDIDDREC